jgi:hypothetical protein
MPKPLIGACLLSGFSCSSVFLFPTKKTENTPMKVDPSAKFTNILKVHRPPPYFRTRI